MNLFKDIPATLPVEVFETLAYSQTVKVERIVSSGHVTPAEEYYDQAWHEWVVVLQGSAGIWIENQGERMLTVGDCVLLPAHQRHRVTYTSAQPETVWLAVHFKPD